MYNSLKNLELESYLNVYKSDLVLSYGRLRAITVFPHLEKPCLMYNNGAIGETTAQKWFANVETDIRDLGDTPCSGRPSKLDYEHLKTLLKKIRKLIE